MRVRMLVGISGGRSDGSHWPPVGSELDVDDAEGRDLCAARLAVPVAEQRAEVSKPAADDVETRGSSPKRSTRRKN